jgi:23S rRNA (cytidine1920-2'-O)/16S rRNA (cytidine1409-2'-O)-methyltransferase
MTKVRIDLLVQRRGLAPTRTKAQRLIQAGQVRVDGQVVDKVGTQIDAEAEVTVIAGSAQAHPSPRRVRA